jgi:SAM-dependent methyltransferase
MNDLLDLIIQKIEIINPLHGKKIRKNIDSFDENYFERANNFFSKYNNYLKSINKDLDFGVNAYLRMCADIMYEQINFQQTGEYSCKSYAEVKERVYDNKEIMEYYINGLLLSQFLWKHHYYILVFFLNSLPKHNHTNRYLEVGAGHGLYISEAIKIFGDTTAYEIIDVSETSIHISKHFLNNSKIKYILEDIYSYETEEKYDFITMGEVLEHVEDPVDLLKRLNNLLSDKGIVFITVPTNAPAIDHVYLFRNEEEITKVINEGGFDIIESCSFYSEDIPKEKAEKLNLTMIYGAFLKKGKKFN